MRGLESFDYFKKNFISEMRDRNFMTFLNEHLLSFASSIFSSFLSRIEFLKVLLSRTSSYSPSKCHKTFQLFETSRGYLLHYDMTISRQGLKAIFNHEHVHPTAIPIFLLLSIFLKNFSINIFFSKPFQFF